MSRKTSLDFILAAKVVAIVRMSETSKLMKVVEAIVKGGIRCVEITLTVPRAFEIIHELSRTFSNDVLVGAGTVLSVEETKKAVAAGAKYIISPTLNIDVIKACRELDVVAIPGTLTPTEILTAWEAGGDIIKVFPVTALGPQYIQDIKRPLPHIRLMPTSGVTIENAREFIKAGACALGLGSSLLDPTCIERAQYEQLTERAKKLVTSLQG